LINSTNHDVQNQQNPKLWPAATKLEEYNRSSSFSNGTATIATTTTAAISCDNRNDTSTEEIDVWKIQLDQIQFHYTFIEQQPSSLSSSNDASTQGWNQTSFMISILQKSEQQLRNITTQTTTTSSVQNDNVSNNKTSLLVREYPIYDVIGLHH
jgi:hypothetical protein